MSEDKKLVIIDAETSCINNPQIVEMTLLALTNKQVVSDASLNCFRFNPQTAISPDASAVHNITDKMVANKDLFKNHFQFFSLDALNKSDNYFLVITDKINKYLHDSTDGQFNSINKMINLKKVLAWKLDDQKIIKLSLHALRYHLDVDDAVQYFMEYFKILDNTETYAFIPRSKLDVIIMLSLYQKYLSDLSLEELYDMSRMVKLLTTFPYGKYKDKTFMEILTTDRQYLEWLRDERIKQATKEGTDPKTDLFILSIMHYLEGHYLQNPQGIVKI
jgi:hypothetical protein